MAPSCIFCDIVAGKIDAKKVFVDHEVLAFHDRAAAAPVHVLVIPNRHVPSLSASEAADALLLGRLLQVAKHVARDLGLVSKGYRIVIKTVPHLHVHPRADRPLS